MTRDAKDRQEQLGAQCVCVPFVSVWSEAVNLSHSQTLSTGVLLRIWEWDQTMYLKSLHTFINCREMTLSWWLSRFDWLRTIQETQETSYSIIYCCQSQLYNFMCLLHSKKNNCGKVTFTDSETVYFTIALTHLTFLTMQCPSYCMHACMKNIQYGLKQKPGQCNSKVLFQNP